MADERNGEDSTDEKILKVGGIRGEKIDSNDVGDEEGLIKFGVEGETIEREVQDEGRRQITEDVITAQEESTNHSRFDLWDVDHPQDSKFYSHFFNKAREDRHDELRRESRDDGRDTNRLDYFKVAPFNVHGDDNLNGIASYGGGGGRTRQLVVGSASEKSIGGAKGGVQWRQWWKKCWRS